MYFMHTSMGDVTLFFILLELSLLLYLVLYKISRPENKIINYNIILVMALITYNIIAGLLRCGQDAAKPDWQVMVSYGAGFLTPCYFVFYIYKFFNLEKMRFNAKRGIFYFIIGAYIGFDVIFLVTHSIVIAQYIFIVPFLFGIWIGISIFRSVNYKFNKIYNPKRKREELIVLLLSFIPWVGLILVAFFNLSQNVDALVTNPGIILLLVYNLNKHVRLQKLEHRKLILSEARLINWNKELKNEVAKNVKEIKTAHEEKINAFIHIAHETKTPLTLINNYLDDYLERNIETGEMSAIKEGIKKMISDVNNLFDIEKSGKGKRLYNHSTPVNVSEIAENCLKMGAATCSRKKIKLICDIQPMLFTQADESALRRIILNLLANAVKYTDQGGKVTVLLSGEENEKVLLQVSDTGVGIQQAQRAKVFQPYYQILQSKKPSDGLGLGLPIVKEILDEIGAQIQIKDNVEDGVGTTIEIIFKRALVKEKNYPEENLVITSTHQALSDLSEKITIEGNFKPGEDSGSIKRQYNLVLIEDNPSLGNYLKGKLSESYNIALFQKAEDAIGFLNTNQLRPDLILSDVMLPGMDGIAFGKWVASNSQLEDIPIIFLSANSTPETVQDGLTSGAIDYITKPFSFRELKLKIDSILASREKCVRHVINGACRNLLQLKGDYDGDKTILQNVKENDPDILKSIYHLSEREIEIVGFLIEGETYKQIAEKLFISAKTVGKHIENIYGKVEVKNKTALLNKINSIKRTRYPENRELSV